VRPGLALAIVVAVPAPALADSTFLVDAVWPTVPDGHALTLEQQIQDRISEIGNRLGHHLDLLSHDALELGVDARGQRAYLNLGGGNYRHVAFHMNSAWHFADGKARVAVHLELSVAGHDLAVQLPDFEMVPTSGSHLEVRLPLFERRF
jgi:hypothetical protein